MKKYLPITLLFTLLIAISCSKVPVTGRKQFTLVPDGMINSMSLSQYQEVLKENKVVTTGTDAQMVKTAGQRAATAVETYLRQNKAADQVKDFKWEFNLLESKEVNAWCMPGGKVAIYTGIMPIVQNETGLAVVMGHEIAHAVARHGSERMSQGLVQQFGAIGLAVAMQNKPAQTQALFQQAYGIGSSVAVMLPFSRTQESEADKLGLIFMAMAGYTPQEAIPFWQRMSKGGGPKPPEMLSTHPSDATRISNIKKFLPTALKYYKGTPSTSSTGGTTAPVSGGSRPKATPKNGGTKATPSNNNTTKPATTTPSGTNTRPKATPKTTPK